MKPILFGAVLTLVWLLLGVPLATVVGVVSALAQPVTIAFVLGVAARPYLTGRRT